MKKIRSGLYRYKGYLVRNYGYYPPDQVVWWEAVNEKTQQADYHAKTKRRIKELIDEGE